MMTFEEFKESTSKPQPPDVSPVLQALWHDARENWDLAHSIVQGIPSTNASWVHAYLHRKEGDAGNAAYWYRRAGREAARGDLQDEWSEIARALLV